MAAQRTVSGRYVARITMWGTKAPLPSRKDCTLIGSKPTKVLAAPTVAPGIPRPGSHGSTEEPGTGVQGRISSVRYADWDAPTDGKVDAGSPSGVVAVAVGGGSVKVAMSADTKPGVGPGMVTLPDDVGDGVAGTAVGGGGSVGGDAGAHRRSAGVGLELTPAGGRSLAVAHS